MRLHSGAWSRVRYARVNRRISQFRVTAAARLAWALCLLTLLVVAATILLVVQNLA